MSTQEKKPETSSAARPRATAARSTAIAIETLDGQGTIRRALLENCFFSANVESLSPENARIFTEFTNGLDSSHRVVAVSAVRAYKNTGAAPPRSETAAEDVRSCRATHHAAFPIVALLTRRTTDAPMELVSLDVSSKRAEVRYASSGRSICVNVDLRVVLCCACDRTVHGNWVMSWNHFDAGIRGEKAPEAPETAAAVAAASSTTPARLLSKQLSTSLKQLEKFLLAPPEMFAVDGGAALSPLRSELQNALKLLEVASRSQRRSHHAPSRPATPLSTPTPALTPSLSDLDDPSPRGVKRSSDDTGDDEEAAYSEQQQQQLSAPCKRQRMSFEGISEDEAPLLHEDLLLGAPLDTPPMSGLPATPIATWQGLDDPIPFFGLDGSI